MPDKGIDPIVAGAGLVQALQSIVSRNIDPLASGGVSICKLLSAQHGAYLMLARANINISARASVAPSVSPV